MSWPIPSFKKTERPVPISLGLWLSVLVSIALASAGAVLMLWPHAKTAQGIRFWALVIGAPITACAVAFGIRLDRWEHEQTAAEEAEREQERISALWRAWSRRHLRVTASAVVLPVSVSPVQIGNATPGLPVVSGRAKGFPWTNNKPDAWRRTKLLGVIACGLQEALAEHQDLLIKVLVDRVSLASKVAWSMAVKDAFSRVAPHCRIMVEVEHATGCAELLAQQVDLFSYSPHLIIAVQFWPDNEEDPAFSEGAAALLLDAGSSPRGSLFRPLTTSRDKIESELQQFLHMQVSPEKVSRIWLTGCDDISVDIRSALTTDPKATVPERLLDGVLGIPGPATSWIALAAALEASEGSGSQLIAWREPKSEPIHLCLVTPIPVPQKEIAA